MNVETIHHHYMRCALWSSNDEFGEPLGAVFTVDDIEDKTVNRMLSDVSQFVEENEEMLNLSKLSDEQIGHDFWLTRNRHGAGFWDRGLGLIGDQLTKVCHRFGEVDLYVGDDGWIHQA